MKVVGRNILSQSLNSNRMWEKINKVRWQIMACMIIIIATYGIAWYGARFGIEASAKEYINKVTDIALFSAMAWLLNSMRNQEKPQS